MPDPNHETFFIGELADRTGVSRDTIRYYESAGVLPPAARLASGYRLYGPDDVERISFVGQAQAIGLTLVEIAETLDIVDKGREPCEHVRGRLSARLEETRERIRQLQILERRLVTTLDHVPGGPSPAGCRCRIIESAEVRVSRPSPDAPRRPSRKGAR